LKPLIITLPSGPKSKFIPRFDVVLFQIFQNQELAKKRAPFWVPGFFLDLGPEPEQAPSEKPKKNSNSLGVS